MHLDTDNRKAFELTIQALGDINLYKQSKELRRLEMAGNKLEEALSLDENFMRALYYSAIVKDLNGTPADAIKDFERLLNEGTSFEEEISYNLAVAHYHRYNWEHLDQAIKLFNEVVKRTTDHSLKLLSRAGLAQAYAMRMIPQQPDAPNIESIEHYFTKVKEQCAFILGSSDIPFFGGLLTHIMLRLKIHDTVVLNEIYWSAHNARGMSLMYYSDYITDGRIENLKVALQEMQAADTYSPKNWANYCDLASVHMRLGHWADSTQDFEQALKYLEEVIHSLRPGYGFALYEEGRIYRLMGNRERAIEFFNKALSVPYKYRDVSDRRINIEKERVERGDRTYP